MSLKHLELHSLSILVESVKSGLIWTMRGTRFNEAAWRWCGAVILLFILDAIWPMPAPLRAVLAAVALAAFLWGMARLVLPRRLRCLSPLQVARHIEEKAGIKNNALINALMLQPIARTQGAPMNPIASELASRALVAGENAADGVPAEVELVDHSNLKREGWRFAFMVGGLTVVAMVCPRLLAYEMPRFADPLGDHPAFTWLDFEISITPDEAEICVGDDVRITARIATQKSLAADLVPVHDGVEGISIPMRAEAAVDRLGEPVEFCVSLFDARQRQWYFIRTPEGRSHTFEINPRPIPRWLGAHAEVFQSADSTDADYVATSFDRPFQIYDDGHVDLWARATLENSRLVIDDANQLAVETLATDDPHSIGLRFRAMEVGVHSTTIRLESSGGFRASVPLELTIEIVEDQPPEVSFRSPAEDLATLPGLQVPLEMVMHDDRGLASAQLEVTVERLSGEIRKSTRDLGMPPDAPTVVALRSLLDLPSYHVEPGDKLRYRATVTDNRSEANGGGQRTTSTEYELIIIDEELYRELLIQRQQSRSGEPRDQEGESETAPSDCDDCGECEECLGEAASGESPGGNAREQMREEAQDRTLFGPGEGDPSKLGQTAPDEPRTHADPVLDDVLVPGRAADMIRTIHTTGTTGPGGSMPHVPPAYRLIVAEYFKAIARAESESANTLKDEPDDP